MLPQTAVDAVNRLLSLPSLLVATGIAGAGLGAGPLHAQAADLGQLVAHAPPGTLPAWLEPLLPLVVGALVGTTGGLAAWMLRTVFGVSLGALAAALDAAGAAVEARAKKSASPDDDAPASALAAGLRAAAVRLRQAEADLPTNLKQKAGRHE